MTAEHVQQLCEFWSTAPQRIRNFESQRDRPAAIYGAGVVGCFIATCLANPEQFIGFIDQNPHKQGKQLAERPIMSLEQFGTSANVIYAGQNPRRARAVIESIDHWKGTRNEYFYL
jgi:2-polyprenyl-6-methoxyphenol hydroxylase-like FAD-dependent oxidoreductase